MNGKGSYYRRFRKSYLLILLVPLLVLESVNFILFRGMTSDSVREMVSQEGHNRLMQMDDQTENIQWISETYRRKPESFIQYQTDYVSTVFKMKEDLAQDGRWFAFFTRIYYYNYDRHYAVYSDGAVDEDLLLQKLVHTGTVQEQLRNLPSGDLRFFHAKNILYGKNMVAAAAPLDWDSSRNRARSCLIFTIDTDTLARQLSIHVDGNSLKAVLSYKDVPIYSTDAQWDAALAKDGSVDAAAVKGTGFPVAVSSAGGMKIVYYIPSGVFNRKIFGSMWKQFLVLFAAVILGFFFISRSLEKNYQPIHQVYRNSMEHFGDMVGKDHAESGTADEVESIGRVMNALLYSKNFLQQSNRELQRETLLLALLENRVTAGSTLYGSCLDHGIRVDRRSFLYLQMEDAAENADLFALFGAENVLPDTTAYMIYFEERYYIVMFCSDLLPDQLEREVRALCVEKGGSVCVGSAFCSVERAGDAYRSLQTSLALGYGGAFSPRDLLAELAVAVGKKDFKKAEASLQKLNGFFDCGGFPAVYSAFLEAAGILSADLNEVSEACRYPSGGRSARSGMKLYLARFYERFRTECLSAPKALPDAADSRPDELEKIMRYIEKHFLDANFSIKSLAVQFGKTPSGMSHYFKKAANGNLSQYIERLKMQKACSMLSAERYKISEIAVILGFSSSSAFTEAFKRAVGQTPRAWLSTHKSGNKME